MKLSHKIFLVFSILAFLVEAYFWVISLVWFFIQVVFISAVASLLPYIFWNKSKKKYTSILLMHTIIFSWLIGMIFSLFFGFILYQNSFPARLEVITLTDDTTTVEFVSMSHIAMSGFYMDANSHIRSLSDDGYTILVEWVRPGTPESQDIFDGYMGFQFTDDLYDQLALLMWMEAQDNTILYAWVDTGSLVSVDLSLDDITALLTSGSGTTASGSVPDIGTIFHEILPTLSPQEHTLIRYSSRALMNWSLRNSHDIQTAILAWEKAELFSVILDKRNESIIRYVQEHPGEKIAIVYGALHFNGIYEWLQRLSPDWKIVSIKPKYPYDRE